MRKCERRWGAYTFLEDVIPLGRLDIRRRYNILTCSTSYLIAPDIHLQKPNYHMDEPSDQLYGYWMLNHALT